MSVYSGQDADEKIGMNPLRTIRSPRPQITKTIMINCDIYNSVSRLQDIAYRYLAWHGTIKSENEDLRGKEIENTECKDIFEVENFGREHSVIWDHKYSDSIHVDPNHTNLILNLITKISTQFTLIQISRTRINPFHPIRKTSDQSMIQSIFMKQKRY